MRCRITTKSKKGTDIILRTENIEIKNMNNLEGEVREYNSKNYGEELIECGIYKDFETIF